jgi:hypothetical protein
MRKLILALLLACFTQYAQAQESKPYVVRPVLVGIGLMIAPIPLTGNGIGLWNSSNVSSGAWMLEGCSFMTTEIMRRILGGDRYGAALFTWTVFGAYRASQCDGTRKTFYLAARKFGCEVLGIAGDIVLNDPDQKPKKKKHNVVELRLDSLTMASLNFKF